MPLSISETVMPTGNFSLFLRGCDHDQVRAIKCTASS
jgi:hypothetical protein